MKDHGGDKTKQPEGCEETYQSCKNMVDVSSPRDFDGEDYRCEVCGANYRLYYDDMR